MKKKPRRRRFAAIALMGNPRDPRALEAMRILAPHLLSAGRTVKISGAVRARSVPPQAQRVTEEQLTRGVDLVIAIGGDGSMLYAARRIAGRQVPLLGINRGRLGFLADVGPEHMLAHVDEILAGRYVSEQRMLLNAAVLKAGKVVASAIALNDVVVKRQETGRMVEYQTFIDGGYVNTHLGDGFIVATPTGSTAYALSCGGPIVEPGLDALVLTPICPHTLSDRPLVIPGNRVAEVRLHASPSPRTQQLDQADVTCDGELLGRLMPGSSVRVSAARERIRLVHPVGYDYFGILRSKLLWGRDTRDHGQPPGTPSSAGPVSRPPRARSRK
ncbi:MAG: NAD(+)/NADH kinase [Gammaproteobacteria bacterium]|nr:NAD(+)/NADH kinase [Gammaproteobacteria bacterium]